MFKKIALALLVASCTLSVSGMASAAPAKTSIQLTETSLNYGIVSPQSDGAFHSGLLLSKRSDGSLLYYNTQGKAAFTLSADLKPVSDFSEQRAIVVNKKTGLFGYINTKGELAIPCKYAEAGDFSEGVAHVKTADAKDELLIGRAGQALVELEQSYQSDFRYAEGLAPAYGPDGQLGYLNTAGKLQIPYQYAYARGFSHGLALVQNAKGLYGYINAKGQTVIPFKYKSGGDYTEGLVPVQNANGKWGYLNGKGQTVIPFRYSEASSFSEGLAAVYNATGKAGYINAKGSLVIGYGPFTRASSFQEGIALVGTGNNTNGKFGYINRQGKLLTKLEYRSESSSFDNGIAAALKSSGKGVLLKKSQIGK